MNLLKAEIMNKKNNLRYMCVRTKNMGVFFGYLAEETDLQTGVKVKLFDARRIWYWEGAATLSQLSQEGTKKPEKCKFPMAVPEVILMLVEEMIPVSKQAKKSIDSVPIWGQDE